MTVLVSDSFNRTDSNISLGNTDSYNGGTTKTWGVYGPSATLPTYGISSNQAYMVSNNGGFTNNNFAGINIGVSDVTYKVTLATASAACYFVLRASDNNHYVRLSTGNPYTLVTYNNGTFTTISTASVGSATGDVISITLNGTSITVSKNGTEIISATSTFNQTSTIFGFSGQGSTANRFDNFQIEDLATGGTTYTDGSTLFDTKQSIYQDTSLIFDTKQSIYQDNLLSFDTKQTIYNDSFISSDTKQSIYSDSSVSFDTIQQIQLGGVDGSVSFNTKQTLHSDSSVQFDTKQGLYSDSQVIFNTKQAYYNDSFASFDTLQVVEKIDWVDGSVSFDTQQLITETPKVVAQEVNLTFIAENEVNLSSEIENSVSLSFTI
jgi:hypothetical protein